MKNQKGMGQIMLILCIIIIIVVIVGIIYFALEGLLKEKMETYETDMLLIQGKVKVLSQEAIIQKNEEVLKGKKLEDNIEEEKIKELLEKQVISQEESNFSKYYIIEKETLEEIGLQNINLKKGFYIVNYDTDEIIYSEGVKIGENTYYKLSELKLQKENANLPDEIENSSNQEEEN